MLLLLEWVFLIICSTLIFRDGCFQKEYNLMPLSSYFDYAENTCLMEMAALNILNVGLFVPVGFLLSCGSQRMTWWRVLCVAVVLSVGIEVLQLLLRRGLCETDDVLHNVVGAVMGYGIARLLFYYHRRHGFYIKDHGWNG